MTDKSTTGKAIPQLGFLTLFRYAVNWSWNATVSIKQTLIVYFYTLPVTDVDAAPSPSKPQAASKPSPVGMYTCE